MSENFTECKKNVALCRVSGINQTDGKRCPHTFRQLMEKTRSLVAARRQGTYLYPRSIS
ncbi:hypothetical protein DESC_610397 [Desulfosarcina cetonica]|nr:hypothetical protein DESC_610397 [Desulfosarcina cetonica]